MTSVPAAPTLAAVLQQFVHHPIETLIYGWNWKSALLSSICRATMFLVINLEAGLEAGLQAMLTELIFRGCASGVLGSATQAFRNATPVVAATTVALLIIPAAGHVAEFTVHRLAGTVRLGDSIAASVLFSTLTTAFNLFAMRRGALVVGASSQSLSDDLRRLPFLIASFVAESLRVLQSGVRLCLAADHRWLRPLRMRLW